MKISIQFLVNFVEDFISLAIVVIIEITDINLRSETWIRSPNGIVYLKIDPSFESIHLYKRLNALRTGFIKYKVLFQF